jgi:hypothetical protein
MKPSKYRESTATPNFLSRGHWRLGESYLKEALFLIEGKLRTATTALNEAPIP